MTGYFVLLYMQKKATHKKTSNKHRRSLNSLVVKKRLITWRQAFPLSLLERYGRDNDQARRRTLRKKWANCSTATATTPAWRWTQTYNGLELYSEIFKQVQLAIAKVATAVGNRFDTAVLQQEHDSELSLDCDQSQEQMPIQHPLVIALAKVRTTRLVSCCYLPLKHSTATKQQVSESATFTKCCRQHM